jgi:hypothetical protein
VLVVNDSYLQIFFASLCGFQLQVLTKVDPETAIGRTYVISEKESCCTTDKLETKLCKL